MIPEAHKRTIDRRRAQAINRSSLPSHIQADMRQSIVNVERIVYFCPTRQGTLYWCDDWSMEVTDE